MKILLFVYAVAFSRPTTRQEDTLNEILKAMDQVYSWKIVNYYGEYQKGIAQVDDNAVKIAFEFTDTNNDEKVSKEEMLRPVFKLLAPTVVSKSIFDKGNILNAFRRSTNWDFQIRDRFSGTENPKFPIHY